MLVLIGQRVLKDRLALWVLLVLMEQTGLKALPVQMVRRDQLSLKDLLVHKA